MSHIILAIETLKAIDAALVADQGGSFREWEGRVLPHIADAYDPSPGGHRSHLGASVIGRECAREIWYGFRWTTKSVHRGQLLRLFNRGHLEEGRFIALFLMIGCEVIQQDENGKQFRITHAEGHAGGSSDGVILNLPDLVAETPALGEFKTHGEKSFIELAGENWRKYLDSVMYPDPSAPAVAFTGKGVREAKFEHYVQMNTYMQKMQIPIGIYVAVNKNTDDIYAEILHLDSIIANSFLDRMEQLVWSLTPPKRINNSPGFYKCRFCDHRPVCHLDALPDRNCRTCLHVRPRELNGADESQWVCTEPRNDAAFGDNPILTKDDQLRGCDHYELDPVFKVP